MCWVLGVTCRCAGEARLQGVGEQRTSYVRMWTRVALRGRSQASLPPPPSPPVRDCGGESLGVSSMNHDFRLFCLSLLFCVITPPARAVALCECVAISRTNGQKRGAIAWLARTHFPFSEFAQRTTHNENVVDPRPAKNWGPRVARVTRARHASTVCEAAPGGSLMTYTLDYTECDLL